MTDIPLAPRVENATSDTEAIVTSGFYQVRPALAYTSGAQWLIPAWPEPSNFTGSTITLKLDPNDTVPYELYAKVPSAPQLRALRSTRWHEIHEFRWVKTTTPPNTPWDQLEVAPAPTSTGTSGGSGGSTSDPELAARVAALEEWRLTVGGDVTNVEQVTGISVYARTYLDETSQSATLTALGAAPVGHTHAVAWTDVTSKPTTFTPATHTHPQSDVTDLVTDLGTAVTNAGNALTAANTAVNTANGRIPYPSGGTDGSVLVKSGTGSAWSAPTTADMVTSTTVDSITYSATPPTGSATNGVLVLTPVA